MRTVYRALADTARRRDALQESLRRLEALLSEGSWAERLRDGQYAIRFANEDSHAYGGTLTEAIDAAWAMRGGDDE